MTPDRRDVEALIEEKYAGNRNADLTDDLSHLEAGEPLAYVIGTIPFLGLTIHLDSRPLIPRPETEWWTEELIKHIGERPLHILDLCAGSGAIGLAILKHCKNAQVSFGELMPAHAELIKKNITANNLDTSRATIHTGNLFTPFENELFDIIATNPPYIPESRTLPDSVSNFEPKEALFAGPDGLSVIREIIDNAPSHLTKHGELWMEGDSESLKDATALLTHFSKSEIRTDLYGRERLIVAEL